MNEEQAINERKEKVMSFFKSNPTWIFIGLLLILVILGVYIRSLPLSDHGGKPGLWDSTTNDYTLGPDLDPFLFLRYAKDMVNGGLPKIDTMRNVPLGFDTNTELQMVSYMIVLTYHMVNMFGHYSINFAGAFMPVWIFALTIIAFFLFVREIFIKREDKKSILKANIIALIATLFMIILPGFLSRTVAGIPEKESVGFLFMFLAFYLFLRAWKSEKLSASIIFGVLAGISTGLMGLAWGGVSYVYVTIGLATLFAFILNKINKKESIIYCTWLIFALIVMLGFTHRFSLKNFIFGFDTGIASLAFGLIILHLILWKTKIGTILKLDKIKLPKTIISILVIIIVGLAAILIINPSVIGEKISQLNYILLNPTTGRWSSTVAENKQPYYTEWVSNFGKMFFWIFMIGSIVLFKEMFNKIKRKDAIILTCLYVFFLIGLIFSRYAAHPALFDGENFISKLFYYGSALIMVASIIYYYWRYHRNNDNSFEQIEYSFIFLFSLFALTLFTARSAVRLIMVLVPIAPIFTSYLLIKLGFDLKQSKEGTSRLIIGLIFAVILIISAYSAYNYYKEIKQESYYFIPSYYTNQWQNAMSWVRTNTPSDAVFAHWWDYGYWVQSIGDRATVTDGGNAIVWWNYLMGRLVLTGDNQNDALNFLWNHNSTYLLIDSSDIGKYGAYSQIGSDANYDRLSQGPVTLLSEQSQEKEVKDGIIRTYNIPASNGQISLIPLEEDLTYQVNGTTGTLFKENSALMGINVKVIENNGTIVAFQQPEAIFYSNGQQITILMRYLYYKGKLYDYKIGIDSTIYLIQRVLSTNNGLQIDELGSAIYISPRVMKGMMAQIYILDNSLGNFDNFQLVHTEPNIIINYFNSQGANLRDFVYYNGLQGPIKIWSIKYTGNEKPNPEYLEKTPPSYITWNF